MTERCRRFAIIGAGFTGTALAIELLRRVSSPLEILLIDRRGRFGRGLAYGTQDGNHLLNVCAAKMSLLEDETDHLISWLETTRGIASCRDTPWDRTFISRKEYGDYLSASLQQAITAAAPDVTLRFLEDHVTAAQPSGLGVTITCANLGRLWVDRAILCLGNPPPATPSWQKAAAPATSRIINDPWGPSALSAIAPDDNVVLVGTGLTMIDIALSLATKGHRAPLLAISRHGLLPRAHIAAATMPWQPALQRVPSTAVGQLRWLRDEIARAAVQGIDWRHVVDAVRPHVQNLWSLLPPSQRHKFIKRLRTYWDIHRHRMAPSIAERVAALRDTGQLRIEAGTISQIESGAQRLRLVLKQRHSGDHAIIGADWIVNCTGPDVSFRSIPDPLIRNLIDGGSARVDLLGLGFDVTADHKAIDADGMPSPVLHALGPITRGVLWEITAVPDIRKQCAALAARLASAGVEARQRTHWMMRELSLASASL